MNRSSTQLQFANEFTPDQSTLPPEVRKLFPRERQIAAIVYGNGLVTARDVEFHLAQTLTNSAVRSFLNRLVRKGLLLQQRCGKHRTIVYAPALSDSIARELAIKQFAEDFYDGSLAELADELGEFFSRPPALPELLESYDRSSPLEIRQLSSRMSEIANIVYRSGASSNRKIRSQIGDSLTRSCIKTLLGRMVSRGLIRKRPSGRHREFVYLPALVTRQVRRLAVKRFIDNRFAGSAGSALRAVLQLTHARSAR